MEREPFRFSEDGLRTIHNCDFTESPRFIEAYRAGEATKSWGTAGNIRWRAYVVCWAAEQAGHLPGDFVECGVNRGGFARMIIEYLGPGTFNRKFYLLDTFKGFFEASLSEAEKTGVAQKYGYSDCLADVKRTFAPFSFVEIVPGPVPDTLERVPATRVSFLSIDMNCTAPEIAAAEFFWPKLSSGALVVLDDYGFTAHLEQKRAFDEFAARNGVSVLSLPTGQGMLIKP